MAEGEHNLVLEHLRALRKEFGGFREEVRDVKVRLASIEIHLASIETRLAHIHSDHVSETHRADRMEEKLGRIERRLDLHEPNGESPH